jgi:hypothetical protein
MSAPSMNIYAGPPTEAWTNRAVYGASGETYHGLAKSVQPHPPVLTVTSVSKAAAASFAVATHGMADGNLVLIEGASGDWAVMNGRNAITSTGAGTFTIAVNSTGFAGSFGGTVKCLAPRAADAVWYITRTTWTTGNPTLVENANGSTADNSVWSNYASLAYQ